MSKRVIIAMSGGVDSSVAACLLQEAGLEVIGVTMQIWEKDLPYGEEAEGGCCSLSAVEDARRVANRLGIPFYVLNFREIFTEEVVEYFADSYLQGFTPNPCIICNNKVKFQALLGKARLLGADYIATGHYVRRDYDPYSGRFVLYKGRDHKKDQSYVLFGLTQGQLAHTLFPVGDYTKEEVRKLAREKGVPTAEKAESQEICFIPDNDYGRFLRELRPESVQPGDIVDTEGKVLGKHNGVAFYTIGQRKGLGISAPHPYYVVDLRPEEQLVVVGKAGEVFRKEAVVKEVNWVSILPPQAPFEAKVKIRYTAASVPALIEPDGDQTIIKFKEPQRAVTPGQAAVFYRGDLLLGGGFITKSSSV